MTPGEFHKFTDLGNFTIRLSYKMWAGVWSDMTFEQVLMQSMKTSDTVTCGRGVTDSALSCSVLGMPVCSKLSYHFEDVCGTSFLTSEQHVKLRQSRVLVDN